MTTQHILVPIDFSAYSDQALDYAIALASKLQARLTLLHVFHDLPIGVGDMATGMPYAYMEEIETELQQHLADLMKRAQEAGVQSDNLVVHGVPFQAIVEVAQEKKADMIVMGTHGRTGLTHVLLGSVAEKVVRLASCPVLVTRTPEASST